MIFRKTCSDEAKLPDHLATSQPDEAVDFPKSDKVRSSLSGMVRPPGTIAQSADNI